jgi:two-component system OmpR family sensor kinase
MNDNDHNSSKKDFFQELSVEFLIHELKDPIAVIETGARTLLEKQHKFGSLSSRQEKTMSRIIRNARKARDMLYSLLEVGRSEAGSFACSQFKLVETTLNVLTNCLEMEHPSITDKIRQQPDMPQAFTYLDAYGISLSVAPDLIRIDMHQDELKYSQIIGNLLKNALHFRRKQIDIKMDKNQDFLMITVIDDGPGVEPEHCESIFERYSQANDCTITPRQGHGLGLAGARIMARCLGGDIELTCNKTEGTKFQLTLPIVFESV